MPKQNQKRRLPATDAEYLRFAEQFTDAVLDRQRPWLFWYVWRFGFPPVPTEENIERGDLAIKIHEALTSDWIVPEWLGEALLKANKEQLVPWAKEEAKKRQLTPDQMARLLTSTTREALKRSLKGLRDTFSFRRGPRPYITHGQYPQLLTTAELLRPAISKLLAEQSSTSHTIPEILKYLQKDYPDACKFLMRHRSKLEAALNDPKLFSRARKRRAARAGVIANALAGSDYNLAFSTSLERVREAQRRKS